MHADEALRAESTCSEVLTVLRWLKVLTAALLAFTRRARTFTLLLAVVAMLVAAPARASLSDATVTSKPQGLSFTKAPSPQILPSAAGPPRPGECPAFGGPRARAGEAEHARDVQLRPTPRGSVAKLVPDARDVGGYAYTAFGRTLSHTEPGGVAPPSSDGLPISQLLFWQARPQVAGFYDFRARLWSPELGTFLQPDRYVYLTRGGTLWSWPGNNPFTWRDPSGRDGFSANELGTAEELADPAYRAGMLKGAGYGLLMAPFAAVAMFASEVEFGVAALRAALGLSASPAARLAGAGVGAVAGGAKGCGDAQVGVSAPNGAWRLAGANRAKIDPRKLTDYALNAAHPVGGNKARVFESALGYNQSNYQGC